MPKKILQMLKEGTATVTENKQYLVLKLPGGKEHRLRITPLLTAHRQEEALKVSGLNRRQIDALLGSNEDRVDLQVEMLRRSGRVRS